MLLNFCHPCLRPEITCSTISTEGYEIKNLVSESSSSTGFLAYSCIKPPINIDLTFICNVEISRVIIWPTVGSQKSSGFQLLAKSTTDAGVPYATVSNAYLNNKESGVIFYRRDINETLTSVPAGFLQRYIKINDQQVVNKATSMRICIVKTENSVPAIGKIEVWGRVSRCCGRDVIAGVNSLWTEQHRTFAITRKKISEPVVSDDDVDVLKKESTCSLEIPEDFLDPITYEIMVQPIILPSGKIVDQFTLERHEQNEAIWGRSPSDPFTGIPFSNTCRPTVATALKVRIDKFLIENSNADEIRILPRTLGSKRMQIHQGHGKIVNVEEIISENNKFDNMNETIVKAKFDNKLKRRIPQQASTKNQHKLPVVAIYGKQSLDFVEFKRSRYKKSTNLFSMENNVEVEGKFVENLSSDIDGELEMNVKSVLSGLKRFGKPETCDIDEIPKNCSCCTISVFYKLPCAHIVCRKVLISSKNLKCQYCGIEYKTSDPKRIHE